MAGHDSDSSAGERPAVSVERGWDGVKRRMGTRPAVAEGSLDESSQSDQASQREAKLRRPPGTRIPRLTRRPVFSPRPVRLVAAGALLALTATLSWIVLQAAVGNDPEAPEGRSKADARRAPEKRSVQPRPGRPRIARRGRVRTGTGTRPREASRRSGALQPSHPARTQPPPQTDSQAAGAPVAPVPDPTPPSGEPAPPQMEQPRGGGGLFDGSRSSSEFGM